MVAIASYVATLGKFGGVYLIALTLPWSLLGVLLPDAIDSTLLDNLAWGIAISSVGVIANSFLIYSLLSRRSAKEND